MLLYFVKTRLKRIKGESIMVMAINTVGSNIFTNNDVVKMEKEVKVVKITAMPSILNANFIPKDCIQSIPKKLI